MSSIKEQAEAYVPPVTKNIVDLEKVPVDIEMENKIVNEGTKDEFSYDFITVDEVEYRVPKSVLKQLKALIAVDDSVEFIAVTKTGEGLKTEYLIRKVE